MPKILAISDLHGSLPDIEPCDLLLIGGDVCPDFIQSGYSMAHGEYHIKGQQHQARWLDADFRQWLEAVPAKRIVGIAGNHDFVFEQRFMLPNDLPWDYLEDQEVEVDGLRIYGSPWVPNLPFWAFHKGMASNCGDWAEIPEGIDILLSHGPMYGYADFVGPSFGSMMVGCRGMRDAVRRIKPKAFICGHIHEGRGHYRHPSIPGGVYNVAHMDEVYVPQGGAVEISLTDNTE